MRQYILNVMFQVLDRRFVAGVLTFSVVLFGLFFHWRYSAYIQAIDDGLADLLGVVVGESEDMSALAAEDVVLPSKYPSFAIKYSDVEGGQLKEYTVTDSGANSGVLIDENDPNINAKIVRIGRDQWHLTLSHQTRPITQVHFPWDHSVKPFNTHPADSVIYYPLLLGTAEKDSTLIDWGWKGWPYPGPVYAPFVVAANDTEAKIVAATNWPPKPVTPMYSKNRIMLRYEQNIPPGVTTTYQALSAKVKKKNVRGAAEAWQTAVDKYRTWLDRQMKIARLTRPADPDWLNDSHGWINVQLENRTAFNVADMNTLWDKVNGNPINSNPVKNYLPWMQFWGQMSTYAGLPQYAVPPPLPGEEVGCCVDKQEMHLRYIPDLPNFAESKALASGRAGYYSRPHTPWDLGPLFGTSSAGTMTEEIVTNTGDFLGWVAKNRDEYKANAHYLDILSRHDFGDVLTMAKFMRDRLPAGSVMEGVNDVYSGAFLISGFIDATVDSINPAGGLTRFPRFGRYFLNNQAMFLGESNGGYAHWGSANNYLLERQAFLLGAKLDVITPFELGGSATGVLNSAVKMIIDKRDEKGWWGRKPVYLDRVGLSGIPASVDIRHFKGSSKEDIFVIDYWNIPPEPSPILTFTFKNRSIEIPKEKLSILIWKGGKLQ